MGKANISFLGYVASQKHCEESHPLGIPAPRLLFFPMTMGSLKWPQEPSCRLSPSGEAPGRSRQTDLAGTLRGSTQSSRNLCLPALTSFGDRDATVAVSSGPFSMRCSKGGAEKNLEDSLRDNPAFGELLECHSISMDNRRIHGRSVDFPGEKKRTTHSFPSQKKDIRSFCLFFLQKRVPCPPKPEKQNNGPPG